MSQPETPNRPYIGGQAVIEGVMMRSPKSFVVSVRRPDGAIAIREQPWHVLLPKLKFLRWPLVRGAVVLAESLHNGYSALKFSADHALPEEGGAAAKPSLSTLSAFVLNAITAGADGEQPLKPEQKPPEKSKVESVKEAGANAMLMTATVMMMAFFIALPHVLTWLIGKTIGPGFDTTSVWFHVLDGVLRLAILIGYIFAISKTDDARKLFQYHGAEHKSIWTYESHKALTVEEATPFTTRHPRCGTSFLFIVAGVAVLMHIALLPFVPRLHSNDLVNQLLMVAIKIPMAFPIAGVAFELQRWSALPSSPKFILALTRPGIWMQSITTVEPEPKQLEIALLSLDHALAREEGHPKANDGVTIFPTFEAAAAGIATAA